MWVPDSSSAANSTSIACSYKQISMHAIARDTEAFPKPCVYIQLDEGSVGMGAEAEDGEDEEEDDTAELRLVPAHDSEGKLHADCQSHSVSCVRRTASQGTGHAAQGVRSIIALHRAQYHCNSHTVTGLQKSPPLAQGPLAVVFFLVYSFFLSILSSLYFCCGCLLCLSPACPGEHFVCTSKTHTAAARTAAPDLQQLLACLSVQS